MQRLAGACEGHETSPGCERFSPDLKLEPAPSINIGTTETKNISEENSSGFHVFEIHVPTLGMGLGALTTGILITGVCVCGVYYVYRRYKKRWERQRNIGRIHGLPVPHFTRQDHLQVPNIIINTDRWRGRGGNSGRIDIAKDKSDGRDINADTDGDTRVNRWNGAHDDGDDEEGRVRFY